MEETYFTETSADFQRTTRRYKAEDRIFIIFSNVSYYL
jgi:hypothetical protein